MFLFRYVIGLLLWSLIGLLQLGCVASQTGTMEDLTGLNSDSSAESNQNSSSPTPTPNPVTRVSSTVSNFYPASSTLKTLPPQVQITFSGNMNKPSIENLHNWQMNCSTGQAALSSVTLAQSIATLNLQVITPPSPGSTCTLEATGQIMNNDDLPLAGTIESRRVVYTLAVLTSDPLLSTVVAAPLSVRADSQSVSLFTVTLKDGQGEPLANKAVSLSSDRASTDTIIPTSGSTTNAQGLITFSIKTATPGNAIITATNTTDGLAVGTPVSLQFLIPVGPVSTSLSSLQTATTNLFADGASSSLITVTLKDANGYFVSGKKIQLLSNRGASDTITTVSDTTNNIGQAHFTVKSSQAGSSVLSAFDETDSLTLDSTLNLSFAPGTINLTQSSISINTTSLIADGSNQAIVVVTLKDALSNPLPGKTVTLSSLRGATDTITTINGITNASGQAVFNVSSLTTGPAILSAQDTTDFVFLTQTVALTFTPGMPTAAQSTTTIAGLNTLPADGATTSQVIVTLKDNNNNVVPSKTVLLTSSRGATDTITPASGTTNAMGQVAFTVLSSTAGTATFSATNSTDSFNVTQTANLTFEPSTVNIANSTVTASPSSIAADGSSTSTVTVVLKDQGNNVVSGRLISLISSRGGSDIITPISPTTNSSGQATFSVKSTLVGSPTFTAINTTDSLTLAQTTSVTYIIGPVNPTTSSIASSAASVLADGTTTALITVTLRDLGSNPVSGKSVSLSSSRGASDTIALVSGTTNSSGQATFTIKSSTVGTAVLTATDTTDSVSLSNSFNQSFVTGTVNLALSTVVSSPTTLAADGTSTAVTVVTLFDGYNNPIAGKSVTLTSSRNSIDTIVAVNGITNSNGQAVFNVTSTTAGTAVLSANDTTDVIFLTATATVNFTFGAVSITQSRLTASPSVIAGDGIDTSTITVTLKDAFNNPVPGKLVSLSSNRGASDSITILSATTNSLGNATFSVRSSVTGTAVFRATDDTDLLVITPTQSVNYYTLGGTQLVFSASTPTTAIAGVCSSVMTIQSYDFSNNLVNSLMDLPILLVNNGSGSYYSDASCTIPISQITLLTGTNAVQFYLKNNFAETITLSAIDMSGLYQNTNTSFATYPGPPSQIGFLINPTNAGAGALISPSVQVAVQDFLGNTVTSSTADIVLSIGSNPGGGTLSGTLTKAAVTGVASFSDLSINAAGGGYTFIATSVGLPPVASSSFAIGLGAPAQLGFLVQPSSRLQNTNLSPSVRVGVLDAQGNLITSATDSITLAIGTNPSSGTLSGTVTQTAINGIATFSDLKINNVGTGYTLTASATGLSNGTSNVFNVESPYFLTANPPLVPSDGLATTTLLVIPRNASGVPLGSGLNVEVSLPGGTTGVTLGGTGTSACRTPVATCLRAAAYDTFGAYFITATSATPGTNVNFSAVVAGTPDTAVGSPVNVVFDSTQYLTISANTTVTSAVHGGRHLYFTGGTATFDGTTIGGSFGQIYVRGGTLTHQGTTNTNLYKLDINAAGFTMMSGTINANYLGYPSGYSYGYGSSGSSTALIGGGISPANSCGGSHGGSGGLTLPISCSSPAETYDDYGNPSLPGGGGPSGSSGGGVVRIQSSGSCLINSGATIAANAQAGAAGGTINLRCLGFLGSATTNAFTASGAGTLPGGGGGRIALVSTGDATMWAGSFAFPRSSTTLTNFKSMVRAYGGLGTSASITGGGAGTIFLKNSSLPSGDLIVDNGNQTVFYGLTKLVSLSGTVTSIPQGVNLPVTVTSTPALSIHHTNLYKSLRVRSDVGFDNGTPTDWTDDNVLSVTSNNSTQLTLSSMISSVNTVLTGDTFRSLDVFDHVDIGGNAYLESYGDIYVLHGSVSTPDTTPIAFTNGYYHFMSGATTNWNFQLTASSGIAYIPQFDQLAVTISGATVTSQNPMTFTSLAVSSGSFTPAGGISTTTLSLTGGSINATSVTTSSNLTMSGGTLTAQSLTVGGNLTISGGTMNHPATTTSPVFVGRLIINVAGSVTLSGSGKIDVSNLGYPSGYSYGPSSPSTSLAGNDVNYCGASHGGNAGSYAPSCTSPSVTYDDYRNPNFPGGGSGGYAGGGVVRLTATGTCTINTGASILANAGTYQAAGGAIYLNCASFAGTAATSAITANGGATSNSTGGGGRIALISSGLASAWSGNLSYPTSSAILTTLKSRIKAYGGQGGSVSIPNGGAGTIFVKASDITYGDLIVDNGNISSFGPGSVTQLLSMAGTVTINASGDQLPVTVTTSPNLDSRFTNLYAGMRLRPNLSFDNGTSSDWTDDNVMTVSTNDGIQLVAMAPIGSIANGTAFRSIDILDHIDIGGNAYVISNGDLYLVNGALDSTNGFKGFLTLSGSATSNLPPINTNLSGLTTSIGNSIITGNLTLSSGSLTAQNLTILGNLTVSGGTINHLPSSSSPVFVGKLQLNVTGNVVFSGTGKIDVSNLGYPGGYSYSSTTSLSSALAGNNNTYCSGSHGGASGTHSSCTTPSAVYDDYRNPSLPGGANGSSGYYGGGVVRLTASGSCTINTGASILANGGTQSAGGTIYLNCASFAGTAGASALTAHGGGSSSGGAGGGGRIALISSGASTSWSGSFTFPTDTTTLTAFKSVIKAYGGSGSSTSATSGGAGTIYLKPSDRSYGDLILDNGNRTNFGQGSMTKFLSLAGTLTSTPTGLTIPVTVTSTPTLSANYTDVYSGLRLRPNLASDNGSPADWTDDNVLTVTSNSGTQLTAATNGADGLAAGTSFRSIDIVDHIDVAGNAYVQSNGDIFTVSGLIETTNGFSGFMAFNGSAGFNVPFSTIPLTVNGFTASVSIPLVASQFNMTSGTLTTSSLTITNNFTLSGGTINHPPTTSSPSYVGRLQIAVGGNVTLSGTGKIDVTGLGYPYNYSFGTTGPSSALIGSHPDYCGGSHGGTGGAYSNSCSTLAATYDDYRNPNYPGGGSNGYSGGGVVRIVANGTCTLQAGSSIIADGGTYQAAGGSVYLNCATFAGSAGTNAITAKGRNYNSGGGGGGGRIALISNGPTTGWLGNFTYPNSTSNLTAFKTVVRAWGGTGTSFDYTSGGAGTIYLKASDLTYGDLIIDNGNQPSYGNGSITTMLSLAGTITSAPSGNTLPVTVTSTPALTANYTNVYSGIMVRPDLSFDNSSPTDWSDDNLLTIASNNGTQLVALAPIGGSITTGGNFRSIDLLDHIDIGGNAALQTSGDLYVTSGIMDTTNGFTGFLSFNGSATSNLTPVSTTLTGLTTSIGNALVTGNLIVNSGTFTVQNLTVNGNFTINGGTIYHFPSRSSPLFIGKLQASVGGNFTLTGTGRIDTTGLGYVSGYSFSSTGMSAALTGSDGNSTYCASSHGGTGGMSPTNCTIPAATYDDYRNPSYPGGGSGIGHPGGGVVRITSTGTCTINSGTSITADSYTYEAAGGSVYLNCSSFAGTAGTNAITANGGLPYTSTYGGGGGGGRIALISTGPSSSWSGSFTYPTSASTLTAFKTVVRAYGGLGTSATYPTGGAGTIYLKASDWSNGDLIIDNGNRASYGPGAITTLVSMAGTVSANPTGSTLPVTVTSTPALTANFTNVYAGLRLRPDLAFDNGTPTNWADDNVLTVVSNTGTQLVANSTITGSVTSGVNFRSIDIVDHLDVGGNAILKSNGDLFITTSVIDTTNGFSGFLNLQNSAQLNLTSIATTLTGLTTSLGSVVFPGDVTFTSGTLSAQSMTVQGNLTISGGTLTHPASVVSPAFVGKLDLTVGGNLTLSGTGRIDVSQMGYPSNYSFGTAGPSNTLIGTSGTYCGSSHGGTGGMHNTSCTTAAATYDDFRNPSFPGGGSNGNPGGGVVRITTTGTCTIQSGAAIIANASTRGAGGSIYMGCANFEGNADVNSITANGGINNANGGGGGGGRIALISTGPSSGWTGSFVYPTSSASLTAFKTVVKALGGAGTSNTLPGGGAGTIFLKASDTTYGDLLIDNGSQTIYGTGNKTNLVSTTANSSNLYSNPNATTGQITASGTPLNNLTNVFTGGVIQVFARTASGVAICPQNNTLITLNGNGTNNFTTATGTFPTIADDYAYRFVYELDHLDIAGNAVVNLQGADLYTHSCDLHSGTNTVFNIPSGSSLTGNTFASPLCVATSTTGTQTWSSGTQCLQ